MNTVKEINEIIKARKSDPDFKENDIHDGYHSFSDLYEFRKLYNAMLFNEWDNMGLYDVHKSLRHHDGELCFGGGWFIVVAMLPGGQITNHYKMADWDLFQINEVDKAKYPFDGHTSHDVLDRMRHKLEDDKIINDLFEL